MTSPALFVIDNVSQTREWLGALFSDKGMNVTFFNSAERFLYEANNQQLGCIILANRLPGIDGIDLQSILNKKQSPLSLIFHSNSISTAAAIQAIKAGAVDILQKPTSEQQLLDSVEKAMQHSAQKAQQNDTRARFNSLTKKEHSVLEHIRQGLTNQQIANELCISLRTVEVHRASIMKKFDASNAVILATKLAKITD